MGGYLYKPFCVREGYSAASKFIYRRIWSGSSIIAGPIGSCWGDGNRMTPLFSKLKATSLPPSILPPPPPLSPPLPAAAHSRAMSSAGDPGHDADPVQAPLGRQRRRRVRNPCEVRQPSLARTLRSRASRRSAPLAQQADDQFALAAAVSSPQDLFNLLPPGARLAPPEPAPPVRSNFDDIPDKETLARPFARILAARSMSPGTSTSAASASSARSLAARCAAALATSTRPTTLPSGPSLLKGWVRLPRALTRLHRRHDGLGGSGGKRR